MKINYNMQNSFIDLSLVIWWFPCLSYFDYVTMSQVCKAWILWVYYWVDSTGEE